VLKEGDFEIRRTNVGKEERFQVKKEVGLALERFYLERRGDAKEIFRLGSEAKDKIKKKKQRAGFIELKTT